MSAPANKSTINAWDPKPTKRETANARSLTREKLAEDVAAFLAAGGEIERVPITVRGGKERLGHGGAWRGNGKPTEEDQ